MARVRDPHDNYTYPEDRYTREPERRQPQAITAEPDPDGVNIARGLRAGQTERQEYLTRLAECRDQGYLSDEEHDRRASYMKPEASKAALARLVEDLPTLPELQIFRDARRTSQAERDRFLDHLGKCFADGRLSQEEYDRRTTYIHTHKGVTEQMLLGLIADLPPLTEPEVVEEPLWKLLQPKRLRATMRSLKWSTLHPHARIAVYVLAMVIGAFLIIGPFFMFAQLGWGPVRAGVAIIAGLAGIALFVLSWTWILTDKKVEKHFS